MCREERKIIRSHVIPEFFLESARDEKRRFLAIRSDTRTARLEQQAFMQPLLCSSCDNFLNEAYEQPFFDLWYRQGTVPTVVRGPFYNLLLPDYRSFKLCLLSILWRAGIAAMAPFDRVKLGEHEPVLRSMLLEQRPGYAHQYPIFGAVVTVPDSLQVANVVSSPILTSWNGSAGYMFVFGGVAWHFLLTTAELTQPERDWILAADGRMSLRVLELSQLKAFARPFVEYVRRAQEKGWRSPWELR